MNVIAFRLGYIQKQAAGLAAGHRAIRSNLDEAISTNTIKAEQDRRRIAPRQYAAEAGGVAADVAEQTKEDYGTGFWSEAFDPFQKFRGLRAEHADFRAQQAEREGRKLAQGAIGTVKKEMPGLIATGANQIGSEIRTRLDPHMPWLKGAGLLWAGSQVGNALSPFATMMSQNQQPQQPQQQIMMPAPTTPAAQGLQPWWSYRQ